MEPSNQQFEKRKTTVSIRLNIVCIKVLLSTCSLFSHPNSKEVLISGMDPLTRKKFAHLIKTAKRHGSTVIISSHTMEGKLNHF